MNRHATSRRDRANWAALWVPGLLVALGAGIATAHGLFEVALGAGVPRAIAWLYPLITDGLALVAYASTARLVDRGRAYAWAVVVLAAGLSGLAQASYVAGGVGTAPAALRFGIGAWPAVAAAIVAHLLFLLGSHRSTDDALVDTHASRAAAGAPPAASVHAASTSSNGVPVHVRPTVQPGVQAAVQLPEPVQRPTAPSSGERPTPARRPTIDADTTPRDRARAAARRHAHQHGDLPTVTQLMAIADVARGTAGTALKELRDQRSQLHLVNETDQARADQ